MRTNVTMLIALLCTLTSTFADQVHLSPRFQTVYILSMANSLDQHLAGRLTSSHVLWVVLQPSSADAVLTETLDENFWNWLERTYPASAGASSNNHGVAYQSSSPPSDKHRGTIFLVDPRSRLVLWSMYELPKNASPNELDRTALRITNQLKSAFGKK